MSIDTRCAMKAVRESINTRINMGPMAKGMIYTLSKLCSINRDTITG